jgi:hypothetical protein
MRIVVGIAFGFAPTIVLAMRKSFHVHRNWKIANAASTGIDSGSTSRQNIVKWSAPSMRAASKRSFGSPEM